MTSPARTMNALPPQWIAPGWPAPAGVQAFVTTRAGGVSPPPWGAGPALAGGMNVGFGSGDDAERVRENRQRLKRWLPAEPCWLRQVHGATVVDADGAHAEPPAADASVALTPGAVCAVMVADCLPVLLAERHGRGVAAAHAGWRGLAGGVLQATAARLRQRLAAQGIHDAELIAWLGPAIGPTKFEVGADVLEAMQARLPDAAESFVPARIDGRITGKYYADLPALARKALAQAGVRQVDGGHWCTVSDADRFYSYRRDGSTGRHVAVIWRTDDARLHDA